MQDHFEDHHQGPLTCGNVTWPGDSDRSAAQVSGGHHGRPRQESALPGQKGAGSVRCLRCRSVGMVSGRRPSPPRLARGADPGREERGLGWLITWLLLALLAGLAVFTRRGRRHPPADETLIAELLGPSGPPTVRVLPPPAPQPQEDEPRPARQPQEDEPPPPAPAVLPAGEGGWLETQLALITAWSERMQKQIASSQADPEPWRCIAITAKGSQCKLLAESGDTKCAIHGGHADRLPVSQWAGHCRDASHLHPRQPQSGT
jgi:hypothetical protein